MNRVKGWIIDNIENVIAVILSGIIAFFFSLNSSMHPWIGTNPGTDSSVFKTVALMMDRGYMPYRDSFDHKGPLLYLLNFIGYFIHASKGIWVIELLFLCFSFFFLYKTARLLCKKMSAVVVCFFSVSILFVFFEGGNFTEEYAMAFIAVSTYIFIDFFLNETINKFRLIVCGLSLGSVLLLRANMIILWVVLCIAVLVKKCIQKEYKALIGFVLWFLAGMLIIISPITIWLIVNHSFIDFWNDYIVFNTVYVSAKEGIASVVETPLFPAQWHVFFEFMKPIPILLSFIIIIFELKEKKYIDVFYFIYMICTMLSICSAGMHFGHYCMIIVPMIVYPLSIAWSKVESLDEKTSYIVLIALTFFVFSSTEWLNFISVIPEKYEDRKEEKRTSIDLVMKIDELTDEDDAISVYGNWDYIYCAANRKHATRYSYQFPIGQVMPSLMDEYWSQLEEELPKLIVVEKGREDDYINEFLDKYTYRMIWCEKNDGPGAKLYIIE